MHMYIYIREYMNLRDQLACHVWAELVFSMIAFHRYVAFTIRFFNLTNGGGWAIQMGSHILALPTSPLKCLIHN